MVFRYVSSYFILACFLLVFAACTEKKSDLVENTANLENSETDHFVLPPLPDTVFFCGNAIVLENFDMRERLDKEVIVNTFYHSSTIQALKRSNRYFDRLSALLKEEGIPEDFKYLCLIESGLTQAVSPAGARGFWQFMPKTAQEYGLRVDREVDERLHIEKSTVAACNYLKDAYAKFNDWTLVAASYNMGMGGGLTHSKTRRLNPTLICISTMKRVVTCSVFWLSSLFLKTWKHTDFIKMIWNCMNR